METKKSFFRIDHLTIKGVLIGFILLLLMIPVNFISSLVKERQQRKEQVTQEINNKWSNEQIIQGPVWIIPYMETSPDKKTMLKKLAFLLPDSLKIDCSVNPAIRKRSIYEVVVYSTKSSIQTIFNKDNILNLKIPSNNLLWDESFLCLGISDYRGISDQPNCTWNDTSGLLTSGAMANDFVSNGLQYPVETKNIRQINRFSLELSLKGSANLSFVPVGKTTLVSMTSPWKSPSFNGAFLPAEPAKFSPDGFTAHWKILDLNRNFPQQYADTKFETLQSAFGVSFLQGTDLYSKSDRSSKYAFLFIGLTFAMYFFVEILQRKLTHHFQYVMLGLALCLFYLLLLSISEYLGFDKAYLIAAIAVITMVVLYTNTVFKSFKTAGLFGLIMIALYLFIYILIQLQDWALILGSIGLFFILAAVMYFSRQLDWNKDPTVE